MVNINLYKLVNACIDHGPGWARPWGGKLRPQAFKLDRSLDLGYSRIKKKEKRTYAKLNASRPRTVVTRMRIKPARARNWQPRPRVITSVYKLSNQPTQASSPQAMGSSFRPQATSSKILEPGYKRTSSGSGAQATRTNEFFG